LKEIGAVEAGGPYADADVTGPDLRLGNLTDGEDLGAAGASQNHCFHGTFLAVR
jgi:hypothetical protein